MTLKERFDFFCRAIADFGVRHVVIRQYNKEVFRHDFEPAGLCEQFSIAKSITGTAVGFAISEGLFSLDDPVLPYFEDKIKGTMSENWQKLIVKHLLTMQMGFDKPYLMAFQRKEMKETDWEEFVLTKEMTDRPGRYFKYSNAGPYLAGRLIERTAGVPLTDYIEARIFQPLGIREYTWGKDPEGHTFAASDLLLKTEDTALFGQLWLDRGMWEGKQLVPKEWIKKTWDQVIATNEGESDYSLLFWRGRNDSLCAVGRHGQYCVMIPEKSIVIAMNSMDMTGENLMEYFWTYLYPYM